MESTNTPAIKATADDDAMIVEAVNKAKVHCVHPTADTTKDIGRVVLAAERSRVAALATPAIQAVAPILTWQERIEKAKEFLSPWTPTESECMEAEIADLRASLAAVPAQQPTAENNHFTPMENRGSLVYLGRSGGFDVRNCPEPEKLAAFIVAACNAYAAPVPRVGGDTKLDELVRDLYNFQGGRHFAVRLEKLIAAPAAPVAPDLASLQRWSASRRSLGAVERSADGAYFRVADVERLLSHTAQDPVGMAKPESIDCPEFRKLVDAYHCADQERLEPAYDALFAYVDDYISGLYQAPVEPVAGIPVSALNEFSDRWLRASDPQAADALRVVIAAQPVEPVSALTDEQILQALSEITHEVPKRLPTGWLKFARAIEGKLLAASPKVEPVSAP